MVIILKVLHVMAPLELADTFVFIFAFGLGFLFIWYLTHYKAGSRYDLLIILGFLPFGYAVDRNNFLMVEPYNNSSITHVNLEMEVGSCYFLFIFLPSQLWVNSSYLFTMYCTTWQWLLFMPTVVFKMKQMQTRRCFRFGEMALQ